MQEENEKVIKQITIAEGQEEGGLLDFLKEKESGLGTISREQTPAQTPAQVQTMTVNVITEKEAEISAKSMISGINNSIGLLGSVVGGGDATKYKPTRTEAETMTETLKDYYLATGKKPSPASSLFIIFIPVYLSCLASIIFDVWNKKKAKKEEKKKEEQRRARRRPSKIPAQVPATKPQPEPEPDNIPKMEVIRVPQPEQKQQPEPAPLPKKDNKVGVIKLKRERQKAQETVLKLLDLPKSELLNIHEINPVRVNFATYKQGKKKGYYIYTPDRVRVRNEDILKTKKPSTLILKCCEILKDAGITQSGVNRIMKKNLQEIAKQKGIA